MRRTSFKSMETKCVVFVIYFDHRYIEVASIDTMHINFKSQQLENWKWRYFLTCRYVYASEIDINSLIEKLSQIYVLYRRWFFKQKITQGIDIKIKFEASKNVNNLSFKNLYFETQELFNKLQIFYKQNHARMLMYRE